MQLKTCEACRAEHNDTHMRVACCRELGLSPVWLCCRKHNEEKTKVVCHTSSHEWKTTARIAMAFAKEFAPWVEIHLLADTCNKITINNEPPLTSWHDAHDLARSLLGFPLLHNGFLRRYLLPTAIPPQSTIDLQPCETAKCEACLELNEDAPCGACEALFSEAAHRPSYTIVVAEGAGMVFQAAAILLQNFVAGVHRRRSACVKVSVVSAKMYSCPQCHSLQDGASLYEVDSCVKCGTVLSFRNFADGAETVAGHALRFVPGVLYSLPLRAVVGVAGRLAPGQWMRFTSFLVLRKDRSHDRLPPHDTLPHPATPQHIAAAVDALHHDAAAWQRQFMVSQRGHAKWCNTLCLGRCPGA